MPSLLAERGFFHYGTSSFFQFFSPSFVAKRLFAVYCFGWRLCLGDALQTADAVEWGNVFRDDGTFGSDDVLFVNRLSGSALSLVGNNHRGVYFGNGFYLGVAVIA